MATYTPEETLKSLLGSVNKARVICWVIWTKPEAFTASDLRDKNVAGSDVSKYLEILVDIGALQRVEDHDRKGGARVYGWCRTSHFWVGMLCLMDRQGITKDNWRDLLPRPIKAEKS